MALEANTASAGSSACVAAILAASATVAVEAASSEGKVLQKHSWNVVGQCLAEESMSVVATSDDWESRVFHNHWLTHGSNEDVLHFE